ncbi:MAG: flagellar motor stator protein MotA [Alphaproteobacteria bacterium]|nr:flagellar motor stator protein MotA [Alphaproteobacteria bacterium]
MLGIIGIVVVFAMVFGSYVMSGGKFAIIAHAAPHEFMAIGGAAVGAFLLANKGNVVKGALKDVGKSFKGPKWKAQDYKDLLALLFVILKLVRTKGMVALEQHIENPEQSAIFQQYPKILHDHFAVEFICDTLRMVTMNFEDPHQLEDMMEKQLEKHHHELLAPAGAIQTMADGIPALGIVAAVLGVIKTMGSISEPVEILGALIGGALVGTFLGVFLAYGLVGPIASKLNQIYDQDHLFYMIIKAVLVSHLQGNAPQVSVEIGRGNIPTAYQPKFSEMEQMLGELPAAT